MGEWVDCQARVRYAETDQMGVAYYGNYFVWFELGRAELCRARGFSYEEMERRTESFLVVVEARCSYRRPLRYDQTFLIRTRLEQLRRRAVTFAYQLLDEEARLVHALGQTVHIVTDGRGHPRSFPEPYRRLLQGEGA